MMSDQPADVETEPSEEQAVETAEATDAESIRESLPEDIRDVLTKRAFSPGTLRRILIDTYYIGPIGIGAGGWIGIYGGGKPGTQMRRPDGALYNFPRSWRYAALQRALNTGLITHTGGGKFAATERGVAVLREIDTCPDCGCQRDPGVYSTYYVGDPNTEGHIESHSLVTYCPECGTDGYGGANVGVSTTAFERDEDSVERAKEAIDGHPDARSFGVSREVSEDAISQDPDVDPEETEDLLETVVEDATPPEPREQFSAVDEGRFGREVITIPGEGEHYRFKGTAEAIAVSRVDTEGDIHITVDSEDRLKVGMSYEIAVENNVKDVLHYEAEDAEWTGEYWTVGADRLGSAISKLTLAFREADRRGAAYYPDSEDSEPPGDAEHFTVTVTEDAMEAVTVPMIGVDEDGELI